MRSKIDDAIRTFQDNTCLKFQKVPVSYGGDHIKMHKGKGSENILAVDYDSVNVLDTSVPKSEECLNLLRAPNVPKQLSKGFLQYVILFFNTPIG